MRNLMLTLVALCIGLMGFAQVTDGDGKGSTDPTAIAKLPGAATDANTGLSIQNGTNNKVKVRQAGTFQSAFTVQDNGSGYGENQALVRQTGEVQPGSGVWNVAETRQSGSENSSITRQEGDYNKANTRQGQNYDGSAYNKAQIQQGVAEQGENNYAAIDQDGYDNQARTTQIYDNSDAWTQQKGEGNKSMITQDAGPNQTDGHYASVQQEDWYNESTVDQRGAGARNTAYAFQKGVRNQAKQFQTTSATQGIGNRAGVLQGVGDNVRALNLFSNVIPTGDAIFTRIDNEVDDAARPNYPNSLNSLYGRSLQVQEGYQNEADVLQAGGWWYGNSNYAEQRQVGANSNGNDAAIRQAYNPNLFGPWGSQYAKQVQAGEDNVAGIVQEGVKNKSLTTQIGKDNEALSFQIGLGNKLNIHQRGDHNRATSSQWGVANAALIVQKDGQSYSVLQGTYDKFGNGNLSTFGNQADILQLGPNGDFINDAIDCYFDSPESLYMEFPIETLDLGNVCEPDC